jgi:hypothetical protein
MNAGHSAVGSPVGSALGHWKFDEGYGATANNNGNVGSTLNGILAVGTSAPTWTNDGKFGKALSFDGTSDYVTVPGFSGSSLGSSYTISAWALADISGTNPIVTFGNDLFIQANINDFRWQVNDSSATAVTCLVSRSTGRWYHYVVASSGVAAGQTKLYLDGVECGDGGDIAALDSSVMQIGRQNTPSQRYWKGSIDEVKIYNYTLSSDEVKVEYNRGKSIVLGAQSTGLGGTAPDNSSSREYCVPGDSSTCSTPVSEWLFNENVGATAYDTSGNNNIALLGIGNSAPAWKPGFVGSGIEFDGTGDMVNTTNELSFSSSTSFTASAWVKTTGVNLGSRYVLDRTGPTNEIINLFINNSDVYFRLRGDDGVGIVSATSPSAITANKWFYLTGVRDVVTDTVNLYINGILKSTITDTTTGTNSPIIRIGNHSGGVNGWDGIIDEVRIYDYARTPAQIMWEYNKGAPVAHYKMDECTGTTIYNSARTFNDSPAGNNGTLTIGASGDNTTAGTCATSGAWANGAIGKYNSSIDFDGTDDLISMASAPTVSSTGDITYSIWVYPESYTNGAGNNASGTFFIDRTSNTTPIFTLKAVSDAYCLQKRYDDNSGLGCGATSSSTIQLNEWTHVVMVRDSGSNFHLYVNGVLSGSGADTGGALTYPIPRIGINTNLSAATAFNGKVDEFKFFNYALTSTQIKTEYNSGAVRFE